LIGCSITTHQTTHEAATPEKTAAETPKKEKPKPKPKKKPKAEPEEVATAPKPEPEPDKPKNDKPKADKPKAEEPKAEQAESEKPAPQPPQPEQSHMVVPIRVALDALAQRIDALVPKTDKHDWTQVTKGDDSPRAEIKYELWRDPIDVSFEDRTFHVKVPVRYAANVRAWIKNPLKKNDWISIAKNETWGTRDAPQRITATIDAEISVGEDWQIKTKTRLDDLKHGDPPSGKICKNAGIEICVQKADVAPKVRKGIDDYLEPRLTKALAHVDAEVQRALDLEKRASAIWASLQKPAEVALPGQDGAWLVVQPSAVGVSQPRKDGDDLRVDVSIAGRIAVDAGKKPKVKAAPLPKLSAVEEAPGFHVNVELRVPRSALSEQIDRDLRGLDLGKGDQKISIASAEVKAHADDKHPHRMLVELGLDGALHDEIEAYVDLEYDAAAQRLAIDDVDLTKDSEALLEKKLPGFDLDALRKQIEKKAHWSVAASTGQFDRAIAAALNKSLKDQVRVSGELTQLDVKRFEVQDDALVAQVIVGGAFEVAYRGD
jgi:hypothetical protein